MNTWLHHPEYEYSDGIRRWNAGWHTGGTYARKEPDIGLLLVLSSGLIDVGTFMNAFKEGHDASLSGAAADMYQGFSAPYKGLPDEGYNGFRHFPSRFL